MTTLKRVTAKPKIATDAGAMVAWFAGAIETGRTAGGLPEGAVERVAGRLSTEPPYSGEHPEARVPLARDLLDAARRSGPETSET